MFRPLATTHFEPTYARRAFPCFDEPQLKAEFTVTITHHKDHSVFFNMPLKTQTVVKGYVNMVSGMIFRAGKPKLMETYCIERGSRDYFVCNILK